MTFAFNRACYAYFDHPYNGTRVNERAVEVPVALSVLDAAMGPVLEVGAVLPHYVPDWRHTVIDLLEQYPGVVNADLLAWEPGRLFDTIISVSTLDHLRDTAEVLTAVARMKSWLMPAGTLFVTLPHGQQAANGIGPAGLDELVLSGSLGMDVYRLDKVDPERHLWEQRPLDESPLAYSGRTRHANTVYLLYAMGEPA